MSVLHRKSDLCLFVQDIQGTDFFVGWHITHFLTGPGQPMSCSVDGQMDTDGRTSFIDAQPLSRTSFLPEHFLSLTIINLCFK